MPIAIQRRVRELTPRQLLTFGWLGLLLYAFPGYMSYDSIYQLNESRDGYLSDGHPPVMAEMWRIVELFVTGPVGMLLIQSVTFLIGAYLLFSRVMAARTAAITAVLLLWFPPIAAVIAVIWKDSQMAGFLMLGLGLITSDRRRTRIWGLVAFAMATAMRHNAFVMTGPLIVFVFAWDPAHRFWKRHLIAIAAWVAVTASAQLVTAALTDHKDNFWYTSLALSDIAATLSFEPVTISDAELHETFAGIVVTPDHDLHQFARTLIPDASHIDNRTGRKMFDPPQTEAGRAAVMRAWKKIVFTHFDAYVTYRWEFTKRLLGIISVTDSSPVYNWFTDIQMVDYGPMAAGHDAAPGRIQDLLRRAIQVVGKSIVFEVMLYVVLALVLLPFAFHDRVVLALLASAILGELALFVIVPTTDWRYSFWLITAVVTAVPLIVARRMRLARVTASGYKAA